MSVEEKLAVVERLEELLQKKDREIDKLKDELRDTRCALAGSHSGCFVPVHLDDNQTLPVPRLELAYEPGEEWGWRDYGVTYRLVYRHHSGPHVGVAFSHTRIQGGAVDDPPIFSDGRLHPPLRDGVHIRHDMKTLGLRGFAVAASIGHVEELKPLDRSAPHENRS